MKVLILHQHFNTPEKGGALRSYYLAKALVDKGIETIVITGSNEKKNRTENYEGIEVRYLPVAYDNAYGFTTRIISFLKFIVQSVSMAKKIPHLDICYAISVPLTVGLAATWLQKKTKTPFIFEVGDLWPDAPIQMGFLKNYFLIQSLFQLEKSIYRKAESIVALSQPIKDAIERKISGKQIHIIPNMADCDFYTPEIKDRSLKFDTEGKFVVSYIGTVGLANGLDHFIECANVSRKAGLPIHFFICGDGAVLPHLKKSAERLALKNITFTGFKNRAQVKEMLNITDAVFISYRNVPILETGSPNKYFDGLAAGKIILVNFNGWIRNEIERAGCGLYLNPKHPEEFVTKIEIFLRDETNVHEFQQAARRIAKSKYDRKNLSTQFSTIFMS